MIDRIDDIDLLDPVERDHPLLRGCVGWWLPLPSLYGSTRYWDVIGRNHGTLTGGPTWSTTGRVAFDGNNRNIDCGTGIGPLIANDLTYFASFRGGGSSFRLVMGKGGASSPREGKLYLDGGKPAIVADGSYYPSAATLNSTDNHTVGMTCSGTNWALYANGRNVGSTSFARTGVVSASTFRFGQDPAGGGQNFIGQIGYGAVWRRGLSATEYAAWTDEHLRGYPTAFRRLSRTAYSFPAAPPVITRRPFFSDWGSMC